MVAQVGHIERILATNEIDILVGDFACHDNLANARVQVCGMLGLQHIMSSKTNDTNEVSPFVENFTDFYMSTIYTKQHFPLSYRDPATLSTKNINQTTMNRYYFNHCISKHEPSAAPFIMLIILLFTVLSCAANR